MIGQRGPAATGYRIAPAVLDAIVRGALAGDERMRVQSNGGLMRSRGIEVVVEGDRCSVTLSLEARFGEPLPGLASYAQRRVAEILGRTTGLNVQKVDVQFVAVFPAGGAES